MTLAKKPHVVYVRIAEIAMHMIAQIYVSILIHLGGVLTPSPLLHWPHQHYPSTGLVLDKRRLSSREKKRAAVPRTEHPYNHLSTMKGALHGGGHHNSRVSGL